MAKREKVIKFSIQTYDAVHYKQTEAYTKAIEALFDKATAEISRLAANGQYNPNKPFSFSDYPSIQKTSQQIIQDLTKRITTTIEAGSKRQWLFACDKNDAFIKSIMDTSKLTKARLQKMQDKNLEALQSFQSRKVNGMNLSKRVWNYTDQYKDQIEQALDVGLGEGRSAQELARDVKQNLKDPNRLYRRVRDKRGNLVLSKNAKAFHPGRGVYRSSVKNAQRLIRSEINMAYRESDFQRWQELDFVVGFEVKRSNHKPLCECDVCKKLAGVYPREFKFKGWHPQCMCYAVPILMDDDTYNENELGDLKAALRGTTYTHKAAKNAVNDVPQGFKDWVEEHKDLQDNWKSVPYFITDNFVNGKLSDGLMFQQQKADDAPKIDPIQQELDCLMPEITIARQQAAKWGLSLQLSMLEKHIQEKNIGNIKVRLLTISQEANRMEKESGKALEDALGIKKGKPMTFEEANELRGNPKYAEDVQYRENCQSAVVANELRRQGWDVEAFGNTKAINTTTSALSKVTEAAWLDANGNIPTPIKVTQTKSVDVYVDARGNIRRKYEMKSTAEFLNELQQATSEPGRYHVSWDWKGQKGKGHIVTAERLQDGKLRVYDPQNGKQTVINLKEIDTKAGINILRVDTLKPNVDVIRGVVKKVGSNAATPLMDDVQKAFWRNKVAGLSNVIDNGKNGAEDIDKKLKLLRTSKGKETIQIQREIIKDDSFIAIRKGIMSAVNKKDPDFRRLLDGAYKAVEHGFNVFILPNPKGIRSADYILSKKHFIGVYDLKTVMGKNSVSTQLHDSIGQANRIILNMTTNYNPRQLAKDIRGYFEANKEAKEVKIFKGKREIVVKRKSAFQQRFMRNFVDEYTTNN